MKPAKKNSKVVAVVALPALMALCAGAVKAESFQPSESPNLSAIAHSANIARLASMNTHLSSAWTDEVANHDEAQQLNSDLQERVFNVTDIRSDFFSDIGDIAGEMASVKARESASKWMDASPASFIGVATGGGVAVGAYGYLNGSDALEDLGINPKFKKGFFDNHLTLKVQPYWESKFENAGVEGVIGSEWNFGDSGQLQGEISVGEDGVQELLVNYELALPKKEFSLHAQSAYDVQSGRTQAAVALWYQPAENMDVALLGSLDTEGESRVGVSVTWRL